MKISTRRDIDAPIEAVFAAVSDFEGFEKQALRRGAEVQREGEAGAAGAGTRWKIRAPFRGRPRDIEAAVERYEPPEMLVISTRTAGLEGVVEAELVALSASRTRLRFAVDLRPRSIRGRLLVQSLKLARGNVTARIEAQLQQFARRIEDGIEDGSGPGAARGPR
ncbi:MAG: SRPBCC family protein [Alphaproteobacteria bacterium]|nr:MAG: SRPBCC family protein [Alphaproteobacteria bacterium]